MKFLDSNGLAHFWSKVKTFVSNNYLSLDGGQINGGVTIDSSDDNVLIVLDSASESQFRLDLNPHNITMTKAEENSDGNSTVVTDLEINQGKIKANMFVMNEGTSTEVLIANGSVKGIGSANGIAGLDSNGYVPLAQLGNLDTTVAEVVTSLPKANIKKHIYLIKVSSVTQNQYEEYLYTGDTSAEYDASKWEKLGDFRPTIDLADYAKKTDTVKNISFSTYGSTNTKILKIVKADDTIDNVIIPTTSINGYGFMDESDKRKLDGIANNANNYSLPTASSTTKGGITLGYSQSGKNYPVVLDSNGKAYVNVPWIDTTYDLTPYAKKNEVVGINEIGVVKISQGGSTKQMIEFSNINRGDATSVTFETATTSMNGFISASDKNKLDGISSGATADSAITTAEIDALFA